MKRKFTRKFPFTLGLVCLSALLLPVAALAWNQATHAYIADRLGDRVGSDNLQEMWGSVVPDFFNYIFDPTLCPGWIADQTQGTNADTFLKVWDAASSEGEDALAYGFASHNQQWGADFVAHISGLRPGYKNDGYIIIKAKELLASPLDPVSPHPTFGEVFAESFGMNQDEALLVAHGITEYAVDIRLGSEVAPLIGRKLATAARGETKRFADLLTRAYAADYANACFDGDTARATSVLIAAEQEHRRDMIYLGKALSRPRPVAVRLLAEQLVAILPDLLGGPIPGNTEEIMEAGIFRSMALCGDYRAEIEATIEFVGKNLREHGIVYEYHGRSGY